MQKFKMASKNEEKKIFLEECVTVTARWAKALTEIAPSCIVFEILRIFHLYH